MVMAAVRQLQLLVLVGLQAQIPAVVKIKGKFINQGVIDMVGWNKLM